MAMFFFIPSIIPSIADGSVMMLGGVVEFLDSGSFKYRPLSNASQRNARRDWKEFKGIWLEFILNRPARPNAWLLGRKDATLEVRVFLVRRLPLVSLSPTSPEPP